MKRFIGAILVAVVAYWLARAVGIPAWRDWIPGDASDCAVLMFWAALLLSDRTAPGDGGHKPSTKAGSGRTNP